LEQGVAVLKEMLKEIPTQQPPQPYGYRILRPAPLPPRPQDRRARGQEPDNRAGGLG